MMTGIYIGFLRVLRFPGLLAHEGPEGRGYIVELKGILHCFAILRWITGFILLEKERGVLMQMRMDHREMYHIFYPRRGHTFLGCKRKRKERKGMTILSACAVLRMTI